MVFVFRALGAGFVLSRRLTRPYSGRPNRCIHRLRHFRSRARFLTRIGVIVRLTPPFWISAACRAPMLGCKS